MQVVNVRSAVSRRLLAASGVGRAPESFGQRAVSRIRSLVDEGERPVGPGGAGVDTTRVFGYAEYDVVLVGAAPTGARPAQAPHVSGHLFCECGYHPSATVAQRRPWLHAFQLPNSSHVDRTLCAEFQILAELCSILAPEGGDHVPRATAVGVLSLFTTTSPCMSCLGAIRQFQLLFPEVAVEASECDDVTLAMVPGGRSMGAT